MVLAFLLAAGCMHQPSPLKAEAMTAVPAIALMDPLDTDSPAGLPESLLSALKAEASSRNIGLEFGTIPFDGQRQTMQRLGHIGERPLLLIETKVWYQSQLEGRFRWEVEVVMSMAGPDSTIQRDFSVPVFHQYHHQREAEALIAAQPVIIRQLGGILDDYIGGEGL
jgi:hypothetical protein